MLTYRLYTLAMKITLATTLLPLTTFHHATCIMSQFQKYGTLLGYRRLRITVRELLFTLQLSRFTVVRFCVLSDRSSWNGER